MEFVRSVEALENEPYAERVAHNGIWVDPKLLADIEYRARSPEGKVRHPFFESMRRICDRCVRSLLTMGRPLESPLIIPAVNQPIDSAAASDRVLFVVEAYQTGLRDRAGTFEPVGIGNELWPFCLEHLTDRLFD